MQIMFTASRNLKNLFYNMLQTALRSLMYFSIFGIVTMTIVGLCSGGLVGAFGGLVLGIMVLTPLFGK